MTIQVAWSYLIIVSCNPSDSDTINNSGCIWGCLLYSFASIQCLRSTDGKTGYQLQKTG